MKVKFARTPVEQDAQLLEWGLERDRIVETVLRARSFYNDCTELHPKGYRFVHAYAEAGRWLRERHCINGWTVCHWNNQTAIRHDELKLRLYPVNFCSAVADEHRSPRNLSEKGNAAEQDTFANRQMTLFEGMTRETDPRATVVSFRGYTSLILAMNFESEYAKAEVSLPVRFSNGTFEMLIKRVPLLDGQPSSSTVPAKRESDDVFGEIEIPIRVVS